LIRKVQENQKWPKSALVYGDGVNLLVENIKMIKEEHENCING
jgi:hypothetical protein